MKLKRVLILVSAFIISACSQTADMYFYADESWQVSSKVTFDDLELQVINWTDEKFGELDLPVSMEQLSDGLTEGGLDMMRSQYASVGIDFNWSSLGNTRSITAQGQTLEQFEKLVPGVFTITKVAEDRYHLTADFTEGMTLASAVYHLDITLHAGEIYSSNAVRVRGGTAQWTNPSKIDVVFSPSSPFPWGVFLAVCGAGLLVTIPFFAFAGKKKCPACGKRVSKKSDYCPNCNEPMGFRGNSGGNYF